MGTAHKLRTSEAYTDYKQAHPRPKKMLDMRSITDQSASSGAPLRLVSALGKLYVFTDTPLGGTQDFDDFDLDEAIKELQSKLLDHKSKMPGHSSRTPREYLPISSKTSEKNKERIFRELVTDCVHHDDDFVVNCFPYPEGDLLRLVKVEGNLTKEQLRSKLAQACHRGCQTVSTDTCRPCRQKYDAEEAAAELARRTGQPIPYHWLKVNSYMHDEERLTHSTAKNQTMANSFNKKYGKKGFCFFPVIKDFPLLEAEVDARASRVGTKISCENFPGRGKVAFVYVKKLSEDGQETLWKAKDAGDGSTWAIKQISKFDVNGDEDKKGKNKFLNEVAIMDTVKGNPGVDTKFSAAMECKDYLYLVMNKHPLLVSVLRENTRFQDLPDTLKTLNGLVCDKTGVTLGVMRNRFTSDQIAYMIYRLAVTLKFIHSKGVILRDIKADDILVQKIKEGYYDIKLTAFESSIHATDRYRYQCPETCPGTTGYRAPEAVEGKKKYGPQSDVFALGGNLHYVITKDDEIRMDGGGTECSVCMENVEDDNIYRTPCNHNFCRPCANAWFVQQRKENCPMCRAIDARAKIEVENLKSRKFREINVNTLNPTGEYTPPEYNDAFEAFVPAGDTCQNPKCVLLELNKQGSKNWRA